jgi:hypothetical protein
VDTPRPSSRTNRTRLVPPPVQVSAEIEAGLAANGHAGAFRFAADTDGYVALEVTQDGFQAWLNRTVSVARYLGLARRDVPCHPTRDAGCAGVAAGDANGLSTGGVVYQARGAARRPLAPTQETSGTCTGGTCYCAEAAGAAAEPRCLESGAGPTTRSGGARAAGGCSCAARGAVLLTRAADAHFGRLRAFSATLPDGVYSLADLSAAVEAALAANGHSTSTFYFTAPFADRRLLLTVLPTAFQVGAPGPAPRVAGADAAIPALAISRRSICAQR